MRRSQGVRNDWHEIRRDGMASRLPVGMHGWEARSVKGGFRGRFARRNHSERVQPYSQRAGGEFRAAGEKKSPTDGWAVRAAGDGPTAASVQTIWATGTREFSQTAKSSETGIRSEFAKTIEIANSTKTAISLHAQAPSPGN